MIGSLTASPAGSENQNAALPVMLVIGDMAAWRRAGTFPQDVDGFHWAGFDELCPDLLQKIRPDVILSPLCAAMFDAMDLAARLQSLGFAGRYRALAADMPNPRMVLREIGAIAPAVDFDIFTLDSIGVSVPPQTKGKHGRN